MYFSITPLYESLTKRNDCLLGRFKRAAATPTRPSLGVGGLRARARSKSDRRAVSLRYLRSKLPRCKRIGVVGV